MKQKKIHQREWLAYFKATENDPPKKTTLAAVDYFKANHIHPRIAIDLGCGDGHETVFILDQAEQVHAIDQSKEGLTRLKARLTPAQASRVTVQRVSFERVDFPGEADWINASFSLPFCPPDHFNEFWTKLVAALKTGGILSGQLFGDRATWKDRPLITTLPLKTVQALLEPFDILTFEETEYDGRIATGAQNHWHVFHFVARKK